MPPAEKRRTREYCFIHCVWHLLLQPKSLTLWTGSDKAGDINEASGPVMAGSLELANGLIASMVAAESAVTGLDKVNVLGAMASERRAIAGSAC